MSCRAAGNLNDIRLDPILGNLNVELRDLNFFRRHLNQQIKLGFFCNISHKDENNPRHCYLFFHEPLIIGEILLMGLLILHRICTKKPERGGAP